LLRKWAIHSSTVLREGLGRGALSGEIGCVADPGAGLRLLAPRVAAAGLATHLLHWLNHIKQRQIRQITSTSIYRESFKGIVIELRKVFRGSTEKYRKR